MTAMFGKRQFVDNYNSNFDGKFCKKSLPINYKPQKISLPVQVEA
jgi:hypothetical protein